MSTCPSKVAWPIGQCQSGRCEVDQHVNVSCSLPLGHVGERNHVGIVRGFARGQQTAIDVQVSWTRPSDSDRSQTSTGVDAPPEERATTTSAPSPAVPTDLTASAPDRAADVVGTIPPTRSDGAG